MALQLSLREATLKEMDACTSETAEIPEQLTPKGAELSQLTEKHRELSEKLNRMKTQNAADPTVVNDQKSVAGGCERPNKRAVMARQCKESSTTPSTAAFSALLADREDYKNCCEALTIENHCIPGLASEAKKLNKKLAKLEKVDTASKAMPRGERSGFQLPISEWLPYRRSSLVSRICFCDW